MRRLPLNQTKDGAGKLCDLHKREIVSFALAATLSDDVTTTGASKAGFILIAVTAVGCSHNCLSTGYHNLPFILSRVAVDCSWVQL